MTLGRPSSALGRAILPVVAVVAAIGGLAVALVTGAAAGTWGYDFAAYAQAAERLLAGGRLYDPTVDLAGGFAVYLYPPPFALAFVPFALLGQPLGLWAWTAVLAGCVVGAVALMPVPARVRWAVLLAAGLSWPTLYAIRLGQVGPILLLLFVLGWRWLDSPARLGATAGVGTLVKIQPGIVAVWALLTGRRRAAAVAAGIAVGAALVTLPLVGIDAWRDYAELLGRVSQPVTTPHNFTPGAVLYQSGITTDIATLVQWLVVIGALALVVIGAVGDRSRGPVPGYMVAVVASQLASPLLWDHYAVVLLAPLAWLLSRGAWWALVVAIATSLPLIGVAPAAVYPLAFLLFLAAPLLAPLRGREPMSVARTPAG